MHPVRARSSGTIPPHPGRRRDKPQLSCHPCRQRKRKCDRMQPCSCCMKSCIESSCKYSPVSLVEPVKQYPDGRSRVYRAISVKAKNDGTSPTSSTQLSSPHSPALHSTQSGPGYKDATHWSHVLEDIPVPGRVIEPQQDLTANSSAHVSTDHKILLFAGCVSVADGDMLEALPPKKECDISVARYFQAQEYLSILHPTEFLKRYNSFWEKPQKASARWLALLYSILCFSSHSSGPQPLRDKTARPDQITRSPENLIYREKIIQCLLKCQYAHGGQDVLETLIHYLMIENNMTEDPSDEIWLLMVSIVQIAIRMGYHRDPKHFKSLSPFEGEMRRRLWAIIYALDAGFATQLGLPTSIKQSVCDTLPPSNLMNSDFDASLNALPPERPISELTASTVILAKLSVATCVGKVSDMVCSPRPLSHEDVKVANLELDKMLHTLPEPCKLRPMGEALLDPPELVSRRAAFHMHYYRGRILVNWKFISSCTNMAWHDWSWGIIVESVLEILRLQHAMADGSQLLENIHPSGIAESCFMKDGYYLAASIACFGVHCRLDRLSPQELAELKDLLEKSLSIWSCNMESSADRQKLVKAIQIAIGTNDNKPELSTQATTLSTGSDAYFGPATPQAQFADFTSFLDDLPVWMASTDDGQFSRLLSLPLTDD